MDKFIANMACWKWEEKKKLGIIIILFDQKEHKAKVIQNLSFWCPVVPIVWRIDRKKLEKNKWCRGLTWVWNAIINDDDDGLVMIDFVIFYESNKRLQEKKGEVKWKITLWLL